MKLAFLKQDLLASIVVFLVALPLCMGIAMASGLPPAAGLITGIIGGIVVGSLSGSPLQASGPAAGLAVIVFEIVQEHGPGTLSLVVLAAGALQILAGAARAGKLFRAISPSVIYGMLAGIGILILSAQFHVMIDDAPRSGGWRNLISIPASIYKAAWPPDGTNHHIAAGLGVGTIVILILWNKFAPAKVRWMPGALVGLICATAAVAIFSLPVRLVQLNDSILSAINPVDFGLLSKTGIGEFAALALTMAFVASAETLLSAAAVDQMHDGPRTQYNKELVAQGVGNVICGAVGGLPITGVIVRSATNVAAGAKTRASTIMHGVWLLAFVSALPWLLRMIPTAGLAAVLVYTGYKLINLENLKRLLRYGGAPVVIYLTTVIGMIVADLLTGILAGLALSAAKIMYARTHFKIRTDVQDTIKRSDIYLSGAASFLRLPQLSDLLETLPGDHEIHVHLRDLDYVDDAALETLSSWEKQRTGKGLRVMLEWGEALKLYRDGNPLGRFQRADLEVSVAAH